MQSKKIKRKLNKKALLVFVLIIYLIIMIIYYFFTLPVKRIIISGNNLVSDAEIIEVSGLSDYPSLFKVSKKNIENKIDSISYIDTVSVNKSINGTVEINVTEYKILFYNMLNRSLVLSSKEEITNDDVLGVPTLINYVPSDIYNKLIDKVNDIDSDIISLISEIEYSPDIKDDVTINDSRFILKMNDGNHVYIDLVNFDSLNNYKVIYSNLESKGIIHLDSVYSGNNQGTIVFTPFDALNKEEVGDGNELSQ